MQVWPNTVEQQTHPKALVNRAFATEGESECSDSQSSKQPATILFSSRSGPTITAQGLQTRTMQVATPILCPPGLAPSPTEALPTLAGGGSRSGKSPAGIHPTSLVFLSGRPAVPRRRRTGRLWPRVPLPALRLRWQDLRRFDPKAALQWNGHGAAVRRVLREGKT